MPESKGRKAAEDKASAARQSQAERAHAAKSQRRALGESSAWVAPTFVTVGCSGVGWQARVPTTISERVANTIPCSEKTVARVIMDARRVSRAHRLSSGRAGSNAIQQTPSTTPVVR